MMISNASSLGAMPRVQSYGQAHLDQADEYLGRLVKIIRGDVPLSHWGRRLVLPIRRKMAMRIAGRQLPLMSQAEVAEVLKAARM